MKRLLQVLFYKSAVQEVEFALELFTKITERLNHALDSLIVRAKELDAQLLAISKERTAVNDAHLKALSVLKNISKITNGTL